VGEGFSLPTNERPKVTVENHIHIAGFFLLSVLFAEIFWHFLIRGVAAHHADSPAWQSLANLA
jgi:hypothetical protein